MKILAVLKQNKILGNIYFSEKIFYRNSRSVPLFFCDILERKKHLLRL